MLIKGADAEADGILNKAANEFVLRFPFGGLLLLGQHIRVLQSMDVPTLGTDGRSIYCNQEYVKHVHKEEGLRGVIFRLCHEYLHVYFNHSERGQFRDKKVWNLAVDIVTNRLTEEILSTTGGDWETPPDGTSPKGWGDFETAEQIYVFLQQHPDRKMKMEVYEGFESGLLGDLMPLPFETDGEKHEWQDGITEEIFQAEAVREMYPKAEPLPGALQERLAKIRDGRVPWARLLTGRMLSDIGGDVATYSPPRKRLYPKLILPRYMAAREKKLLLAIDNSASVGQQLHVEFQAAVMPAARRAHETHVLGFDAVVRETFVTKRPEDIAKAFKYKQGGHTMTSVVEVFEYADKINPSAIGILTDGYIKLPDYKPSYEKAIFCIPQSGHKQPWGRTFLMDVAW